MRAMLLACLLGGPLVAEQMTCPDVAVTVTAPTAQLSELACTAARDAVAQFARCDLGTPRPLVLRVLDDMDSDCVGIFHCADSHIEVLSPSGLDAVRDGLKVFAHVPAERLFASVIHHEMAHALYEDAPCPFGACVATSEYFAYTQQIAALLPEDRAPIEVGIETQHPVSRDTINTMVLFMAPDVFIKTAWAHFSTRPDPCAWWRGMLDGQVLFDQIHP